jgi:cbb3-type cytochrome oxidase maturation protein
MASPPRAATNAGTIMGLEVLYLLIPVSLALALAALALFIWAIHSGQFDDLETPAIRILNDEERTPGDLP